MKSPFAGLPFLPILTGSMAALLAAVGGAQAGETDTTRPTLTVTSYVAKKSGDNHYRFSYYVRATDNVALRSGEALEFRGAVAGGVYDSWRRYPYNEFAPLEIELFCTEFRFQLRSVDQAGNKSPIVTHSYPPFILSKAPNPNAKLSRFRQLPIHAESADPSALVADQDLNADRKRDIVVADRAHNSVRIIFGNGQGSKSGTLDLPLSGPPDDLVIADFNQDQRPDLAIAIGGLVEVRLNQGVDSFGVLQFTTLGTFDPGTKAESLAAAIPIDANRDEVPEVRDLNSDGFPDLVAAGTPVDSEVGRIGVLLSNGTGGFLPATSFIAGKTAGDLALGDFNGDGSPDVAVVDSDNYKIFVLLATAGGALGEAAGYLMRIVPQRIVTADLTRDGKTDIVMYGTGYAQNTDKPIYGTLDLLQNTPGTGGAASTFVLSAFPTFVTDGMAGDFTTRLAGDLQVADITGDKKLEVIVANPLRKGVTVVRTSVAHTDTGAFSYVVWGDPVSGKANPNFTVDPDKAWRPRLVALGDLNKDGKLDVVAGSAQAKGATTLLNVHP